MWGKEDIFQTKVVTEPSQVSEMLVAYPSDTRVLSTNLYSSKSYLIQFLSDGYGQLYIHSCFKNYCNHLP